VLATIVPLALVWYGAEACLARRAGWHFSLASIPACIVRDLSLPVLWVCAWAGNDFEWRGNAMTVAFKSAPTGAGFFRPARGTDGAGSG
jgi:ceramide glucosyltransferase